MAAKADPSDTNFTVFIRLPFPRNEFVDPSPVEWNAAKDHALWDILSRPSKGDNIDWKALADNFDVTLQFLLQQAAWLYDRQFSQVRAQMRRFDPTAQSTAQSNPPSPAPGSVSGSQALGAPTSKAAATTGPRVLPTRPVSQQKETSQRVSGHGRRTSSTSTTTINQFRASRDVSRTDTPTGGVNDQRRESFPRHSSMSRKDQPPVASFLQSPTLQEEDLSSSPSESDSEEDVPVARQFRRFGQFSMHRAGLRDDDNDDDEDETPAFLPSSHNPENGSRDRAGPELDNTLRQNADRSATSRRQADRPTGRPAESESSTSSLSSGPPVVVQGHSRRSGQGAGALGPRRVGEPPRLSPQKSNTSGRASDGTPSMGSSFSDLDDASVTQSALEEALMSNMQHGGMASRMSTISQALRSRYLQ